MSKDKNHKEEGLPAEKMAILAEQGLEAAKLTREEKQYLLRGGLTELYDVWEFTEQNIPPLESEAVEGILEGFSSLISIKPKLWIRFIQGIIEIVELAQGWNQASLAFAHRGEETKDISFYKEAGKLTVHLQIVPRDGMLADIHLRLTDSSVRPRDSSGKDSSSFEVELLKGEKGERCIETASTSRGNAASFSSIEIGDYIIRISDSKGEIISIPLRME
jgi:hypothetical protein